MNNILNPLEVDLLLTAIKKCYGYEFHDYAKSSMNRRLNNILRKHNLDNLGECQHRLIHSRKFFYALLNDITITVSDIFRNPEVFQSIVELVFPSLKKHSAFKVWHAGCATGEEVYSMVILLLEHKLFEQAVIYATDINPKAIEYSRNGLCSKKSLLQGKQNFLQIYPNGNFEQYFATNNEDCLFNQDLLKNIVFSKHNLVLDQSFSEMQLILCRNVLIYFNKHLQSRVLKLFTDSLSVGGYLCLGKNETIDYTNVASYYRVVDKKNKIYQKIREGAV